MSIIPTLSEMIADIRVDIHDVATPQALTDAVITRVINDYLYWIYPQAPRVLHDQSAALTLTANQYTGLLPSNQYSEVLAVCIGSNLYSGALRTATLEEVLNERATLPPSGVPRIACAFREATGDVSSSSADKHKWRIVVHPPVASQTNFTAIVSIDGSPLTLGTDSPELRPSEARIVRDMAAAHCAHLLGRSQPYIDNLLRAVPENLRSTAALNLRDGKPGQKGR